MNDWRARIPRPENRDERWQLIDELFEKIDAKSLKTSDLLRRLSNHIAAMAPHQKDILK